MDSSIVASFCTPELGCGGTGPNFVTVTRTSAFLPLLSVPILFAAAPTLIYNFLSAQPFQSGIYNQYMAPVIPFIAVAAVLGLHNLRRYTSKGRGFARIGLEAPASSQAVGLGVSLLLFAILGSWIYENPVTGHPYLSELNKRRIAQIDRSTTNRREYRLFNPMTRLSGKV